MGWWWVEGGWGRCGGVVWVGWGGQRAAGAGGGGFLLLFAKPERQAAIRQRLSTLIHVPFNFEDSGSRVVLYQPTGL